nr:unnamed protein product [Digitaria exilis]
MLSASMQRLTSLHFLNLSTCDALTQLPQSLGELPALQKFWIKGCLGLTSLPCSIKRLTALEELKISYCPELVRPRSAYRMFFVGRRDSPEHVLYGKHGHRSRSVFGQQIEGTDMAYMILRHARSVTKSLRRRTACS